MTRAWPSIFTIVAQAVVACAVRWAMAFLVYRLSLPPTLWLIPIFGGVGGAVGSLMDHENQFYLVTFEFPSADSGTQTDSGKLANLLPSVHMGIVADVIMGLAGATSAAFLFNKTLDLKFDHQDVSSAIIVIGLSLVAGVFGRKIIRKAGDKLSEEDVRNLSKAEALNVTGTARAQSLTQDAEDNIKKGVGIERALEMSEAAIKADPKYIKAYVTKARALKRLNKLNEAVEVLNKALVVQPGYPYALYNRACYGALLRLPPETILADLEQAINALPKFAVLANSDEDLVSLRGDPRFAELVLKEAKRAIEADQNYFEGFVAVASALERLKRPEEALAAINRALQIKATDPSALYKRASYLALLGRPNEEVLRDLDAAIKLAPGLANQAGKDHAFAALAKIPEFIQLLGTQTGGSKG